MSLSIAPHAASPPGGDLQQTTYPKTSGDGRASTFRSVDGRDTVDPTARRAATDRRATNNQISYDSPTGLMVVRTVDLKSGEVVGQNPAEAYLRLAHAMTEAVRVERGERGAARPVNTDVVA